MVSGTKTSLDVGAELFTFWWVDHALQAGGCSHLELVGRSVTPWLDDTSHAVPVLRRRRFVGNSYPRLDVST